MARKAADRVVSTIIAGKNTRKPYTVRYWLDGKQRERSFATSREAKAFIRDTERAAQYRSPTGIETVTGSGPVEIPVSGVMYAVYRLWDASGACLYVGQSKRVHPILRVMSHRRRPWWSEVARADYLTVLPEHLDQAELDQIRLLNPRYNIVGKLANQFSPPLNDADLKRLLALANGGAS